jgi:hypothetical protein
MNGVKDFDEHCHEGHFTMLPGWILALADSTIKVGLGSSYAIRGIRRRSPSDESTLLKI